MQHVYDDGGRAASGFQGLAGDCVCRSIAIASGVPYKEVYRELAMGSGTQRKSSRTGYRSRTAREGIDTGRKWFKDYMRGLGFRWVPTMTVGSGCKVHLTDGELPMGRLVVSVSRHYTAVINGVIHDNHDPQREMHCIEPDHGGDLKAGQWRNENGICSISRRCVYGYWIKENGKAWPL
jgi:hypothetical protein